MEIFEKICYNGVNKTYPTGGNAMTLGERLRQARLEAGMVNYRDVLRKQFGIDPDAIQGAGAAGGLGAALVLLGGFLIYLGINPTAREVMERKLFI